MWFSTIDPWSSWLLETYLSFTPQRISRFRSDEADLAQGQVFLKKRLKRELAAVGDVAEAKVLPLLFYENHRPHAASAFFPSPFKRAAVCLDGVGEWATSYVCVGEDRD
jgi:carbamoyltransferase